MLVVDLMDKTIESSFIEWCCSLAQGFIYVKEDNWFITKLNSYTINTKNDYTKFITYNYQFITLLHRAFEGYNKINASIANYILLYNHCILSKNKNVNDDKQKTFLYSSYDQTILFSAEECALWHCLLDIYKGEHGQKNIE